MMDLGRISVLLGVLLVGGHLFLVAAPARAGALLRAFPRSRMAAWVLTAIALIWAGRLFMIWPLLNSFLEGRGLLWVRPYLYVFMPVSFLLIVFFMDELLAPRALGGLCILLPAPILAKARWHESGWAVVMAFFCYAMVIAGILLVLSPYYFRMAVQFCARDSRRCRITGSIGIALGALLAGLGVFAF